MVKRYRVLSHTADTAIEAEGATLDGLVENLAYGMFDLMFDLDGVAAQHIVEVELSAPTREDLIVDVLAELLYEDEAADLALSSFSARIDGEALSARVTASGSTVTNADLRGPPIKAVTYHDFEVTTGDSGWYGRVVFDV